ncbi:uncharacterized protein LOC117647718 [Thrips palmi]|uniref:Uncharacterized protein LOC117647718 n=1 Tax=Thrips palmi TaxID=161013 RepID=A0A6P8ZBR3_THRPL|nr:uncharacterized protein LOC117647718 [Thrips palmi]
MERMTVLEFLSAASYHCSRTYSRVALEEEVRGEALELEDMELPAGAPQDDPDPVETPATETRTTRRRRTAGPRPAAGSTRTRGRARAAGAAAGTVNQPVDPPAEDPPVDLPLDPVDPVHPPVDPPVDLPVEQPVEQPVDRVDPVDPPVAAVGRAPRGRRAAASPARRSQRNRGRRGGEQNDEEHGTEPTREEVPRGRVRAARANAADRPVRVARVTRRSPAVAAEREERAVRRLGRAAQAEREAEAEANRQILQLQEDLNAGQPYWDSFLLCVVQILLQGHTGFANKALIFLLAGISVRWKLSVHIEFTSKKDDETPSDGTGEAYANIFNRILTRTEEIGFHVCNITLDMGADNMSFWKYFGITGGRFQILKSSIPHPIRLGGKVFFCPDAVHVMKSMKSMFEGNGTIILPADIVEKENLPSAVVDYSHIDD